VSASRQPRVVSVQETLADLSAFDSIIDVRSPSEFALDHLPGAINLPVLFDDERADIGTLHTLDSFHANRKGAATIARNIARHLDGVLGEKPKNWKPLIYCWRGGGRSGAMGHILAQIGWKVSLLQGGYKAYRQAVVAGWDDLCGSLTLRIVCGVTGSGKTRFLHALKKAGRQVVDLEGLARHRGSLLGADPLEPQPTQKQFESNLRLALLELNPKQPVFVESESKKIGNVQVPDALMVTMRRSSCLVIDLPLEARVRLLCDEYQHFFSDPERLMRQLDKMLDIAGHARIGHWKVLVTQRDWPTLVRELLIHHYDPSYRRSIGRNYPTTASAERVELKSELMAAYEEAAASLSV